MLAVVEGFALSLGKDVGLESSHPRIFRRERLAAAVQRYALEQTENPLTGHPERLPLQLASRWTVRGACSSSRRKSLSSSVGMFLRLS